MTRKAVAATLVICDECKHSQLIQTTEGESVEVVLAQEGWHLLRGKDFCSNACFQIALAKTPTDFPFWSY
jgi:hypothetical protein